MKRIIWLILTLLVLTSCSENEASTAYCFTMIFEKNAENAVITMYCKKNEKTSSEEMTDISEIISGTTFTECLDKTSQAGNKIYFNSIIAYYFSNDLTETEKNEIAVNLLSSTKYRTDNYIYHNPEDNPTIKELHSNAQKVCKDESIANNEKNMYQHFLIFLKNHKN